jgi:conjugative relaxase-like TrwC/TraI family protein
MITIPKLGVGTAQSDYRTDFAAASNRYYSEGKTLEGRWQGELAAELGLKGAVTDEQFDRLTEGQHPNTGDQLIKHRQETEKSLSHIAAWDLTFRPGKVCRSLHWWVVMIAWPLWFVALTITLWRL